jgi:hypothetical protein
MKPDRWADQYKPCRHCTAGRPSPANKQTLARREWAREPTGRESEPRKAAGAVRCGRPSPVPRRGSPSVLPPSRDAAALSCSRDLHPVLFNAPPHLGSAPSLAALHPPSNRRARAPSSPLDLDAGSVCLPHLWRGCTSNRTRSPSSCSSPSQVRLPSPFSPYSATTALPAPATSIGLFHSSTNWNHLCEGDARSVYSGAHVCPDLQRRRTDR